VAIVVKIPVNILIITFEVVIAENLMAQIKPTLATAGLATKLVVPTLLIITPKVLSDMMCSVWRLWFYCLPC